MSEEYDKCRVADCTTPIRYKKHQLCNAHYLRWTRYGRFHSARRPYGGGTPHSEGYWLKGGEYEHRIIAEALVSGQLPDDAEIHHVDGNTSNNAADNLVVCPSRAYHMLLHKRQKALEVCGNAEWVRCIKCSDYGDPASMYKYPTGPDSHRYAHKRKNGACL